MSDTEFDVVVPRGLRTAFGAAKDAKLLTVHGIDGAGCGWLTIRLLADWLRFCTTNPDSAKSDVGILLYSFKHNFEYYANHLSLFGINLTWHLEQGHLIFMGNQFLHLVTNYDTHPPTPPSTTFDASLELVHEMADEMKEKFERTVLLLDNPEMGMMLTSDDDDVRVENWLIAIDKATYRYDNAMVSMVVEFAHPIHFPVTDRTADASASAVCSLNLNSQMAVTVRPNDGLTGTGRDGRVSVVYRMDYEVDISDEHEYGDEDHNFSVSDNGRSIDIMGRPF